MVQWADIDLEVRGILLVARVVRRWLKQRGRDRRVGCWLRDGGMGRVIGWRVWED